MKHQHIAKFVYFFMKSKDLLSMNAGSAVPSMTTDILNKMTVAIPDEVILRQYDETISPVFYQMRANSKESNVLSSIRDSILPKLMSGEIQIPVEEVH